MTSAGVSGVAPSESGAASGLVNTAHQLGSSIGLGILVTAASQTGSAHLAAPAAVADHGHAALTGSSVFLLLGLAITVIFIVRPGHRAVTQPTPTRVPAR